MYIYTHCHDERCNLSLELGSLLIVAMGRLRLVGSLRLNVSFAKEPSKRDDILQKSPIILRNLLIVATPQQFVTHTHDLSTLLSLSSFSLYLSCTHTHTHTHAHIHSCNTLLQHTPATHYCNSHCTTLQNRLLRAYILQHTTATHYCNTLLQHTTATHTAPHSKTGCYAHI